jgi:hypothetical protein
LIRAAEGLAGDRVGFPAATRQTAGADRVAVGKIAPPQALMFWQVRVVPQPNGSQTCATNSSAWPALNAAHGLLVAHEPWVPRHLQQSARACGVTSSHPTRTVPTQKARLQHRCPPPTAPPVTIRLRRPANRWNPVRDASVKSPQHGWSRAFAIFGIPPM